MRSGRLLAALLLSMGLCFVPVLGYGEIPESVLRVAPDYMDLILLEATVNYIMFYPDGFLLVMPDYDKFGLLAGKYPAGVKTKGKINIIIKDNRGIFSGKYSRALLNQFKIELERFYFFIERTATDKDIDIVARFTSMEGKTLGYFYQGEYHLWKEWWNVSSLSPAYSYRFLGLYSLL